MLINKRAIAYIQQHRLREWFFVGSNDKSWVQSFWLDVHFKLDELFQDNKISHIEGDEDDRKSPFAEVPLLETLALDGNEIR